MMSLPRNGNTIMTRPLTTVRFDNDSINWRQLGEFEYFRYTVIDVDSEAEVVDFALRLDANERILLHRHRALTMTTVLQGEHRLYEPDGRVKDIRPLGSYTVSPASPEPHTEGGGADGAIVLYSTRGSVDGVIFDVVDDAGNDVGTLTVADFAALYDGQGCRAGG